MSDRLPIKLDTLGDVVKLLKSKEARDEGVEADMFRENGMASIEAVATGLRARGYGIQGFQDSEGVKRIRLLGEVA